MKKLNDWAARTPHQAAGASISFSVLVLDWMLKNARAARFVGLAAPLLAILLGGCVKELWPAHQLSEGIVFETQHSIESVLELQKAHRNCQRAPERGRLEHRSRRADPRGRAREKSIL